MAVQRPIIRDLPRSRTDVVLEGLAFVTLLVLIAMPLYSYSLLPDSIPQHFNIKGEVDGWGHKSSLILMPAVGLILYMALTLLSGFPHRFNYLWAITEENARRQYLISRQMIVAMKLIMVLIFAYISSSTIRTALGIQRGMNPLLTFASAPVLFAVIGFYLYKGSRAK
jgi:uncharacterized membrane protein